MIKEMTERIPEIRATA